VTGFQIIEEMLDRNARRVKTGRAAQSLGIDPNQPKQRMAGLNQIADKIIRSDRLRAACLSS
jgi:hypothetical protein